MKSKDWMYIVASGASLRLMRESAQTSQETKHRENERFVSPQSQGLQPVSRHLLVHEVGGRYTLRCCRWDDSAMSWVALTRGNQILN